VIPFNIDGIIHSLLAAILGYEGGIGVRSGCFCSHPYVVSLLGLDQTEIDRWKSQFLAGNKSDMPGMVRMSFGCYSNEEDVDRLIDMLHRVVRGEYEGEYRVHKPTGEFFPIGYEEPFARYFSLENDN